MFKKPLRDTELKELGDAYFDYGHRTESIKKPIAGIFDRRPWEDRQQDKISKLRSERMIEEKRGHLRQEEVRERNLISQAKSKGKGGGSSFFERAGKFSRSAQGYASKGAVAMNAIDARFAGMSPVYSPFGEPEREKPRHKHKPKGNVIIVKHVYQGRTQKKSPPKPQGFKYGF